MNATSPPPANDESVDPDRNERLADLLLEVARSISPDVAATMPSRLGTDPQLDAMRTVLLHRELASLADLEDTIQDPERLAQTVSTVLPHAFELSGARDERLGQVLAPTMERATQASIRKDPGTLVSILYPVMGPAIRKAIAETMNSTLQGLNQALRFAFSWRGIRWRMEAWRSGSSFADIVLKHTLVYRVEHLFLIHRKTGLLLEHVAASDAAARDPQLVSGMLTAIQDFVADSFSEDGSSDAVDSLRLGDLLLWCEAGPQAYLAAVIRGTPPETLRDTMRETLHRLHHDLRGALDDYNGDNEKLGDLASRLDPCLAEQVKPPERRLTMWLWILPLLLLGAGGYWLATHIAENRRVESFVERLRQQPGIVVINADRVNGGWQITGLRDPLAVEPDSLLGDAHQDASEIHQHWEPYAALSPTIVLRRLRKTLPPLPSVAMSLDHDTIRMRGGAPRDWVDKARNVVRALPAGAPPVDLSGLTDVVDPDYVRLRKAVQTVQVYFDSGAPNPAAGQEQTLDKAAADIRDLARVAKNLGFSVTLTIVGHTDSTGKETSNLGLSIARAEVVRSLMQSRGIAPDMLSVRGTGTLEPLAAGDTPNDLSLNRCVTFTVNTKE